jgi:hypothetical protein
VRATNDYRLSKKWSISPETLRATVKRVGVMAKDVAKHLNKPVP